MASLERTSAAAGGERGGEHREGREPGERRSLRYLQGRGGGAGGGLRNAVWIRSV